MIARRLHAGSVRSHWVDNRDPRGFGRRGRLPVGLTERPHASALALEPPTAVTFSSSRCLRPLPARMAPSTTRDRDADIADRVGTGLAQSPDAKAPIAIGVACARVALPPGGPLAKIRVSLARRPRAAKSRRARCAVAVVERAGRRHVAALTLAGTGDTPTRPRIAAHPLGAAVALLVAPASGDPRNAGFADDRQRSTRPPAVESQNAPCSQT